MKISHNLEHLDLAVTPRQRQALARPAVPFPATRAQSVPALLEGISSGRNSTGVFRTTSIQTPPPRPPAPASKSFRTSSTQTPLVLKSSGKDLLLRLITDVLPTAVGLLTQLIDRSSKSSRVRQDRRNSSEPAALPGDAAVVVAREQPEVEVPHVPRMTGPTRLEFWHDELKNVSRMFEATDKQRDHDFDYASSTSTSLATIKIAELGYRFALRGAETPVLEDWARAVDRASTATDPEQAKKIQQQFSETKDSYRAAVALARVQFLRNFAHAA